MELLFDKIIRKTGRKPVSCKCVDCKKQCQTPCLGTPEDIERIMDAGYGDRLTIIYWAVGMLVGEMNFPIPMIQAVSDGKGCAFFENGLCILHDKNLKPTEGRLSHHSIKADNFVFKKSISWNVAKEWINPENEALLKRVILKFKQKTFMM